MDKRINFLWIAFLIVGLWVGYLFRSHFHFTLAGIYFLTIALFLVSVTRTKHLPFLLVFIALLFFVTFLTPSMSYSMRVKNQSSVDLNVYVIDLQTKITATYKLESGTERKISLCSGDALEENSYLVTAVDAADKIWFSKAFTIKDYPNSDDRLFVIGKNVNVHDDGKIENLCTSRAAIASEEKRVGRDGED